MNKRDYIITFLIILTITFGIYSNSLNNEFINYWDDNTYVTGNDLIKSLKIENLKLIFTSIFFTDYYPVNILSYAIDYHFWGLNPLGYHITNVLIHTLNAFLIFLIIFKISKDRLTTLISTIIFIIHPVNVETVAWVAERKNVLSFLFFLVSFYLYIKHQEKKTRFSFYIASLLVYFLGILTKSNIVILPLLLFAYDFCFSRKRLKDKIIDKIPFLAISCIGAATTLSIFSGIETFSNYHVGLYPRILSFLKALIIYIGKLFIPINLNNRYFYNLSTSISDWHVIASILILSIIVFIAFKCLRKEVSISFCIMWFFIGLIPVSNIIPGPHWLAERYLYLPSLGFSLLIGTLLSKLYRSRYLTPTVKKTITFSILALVFCSYSYQTFKRNYIWKDSITLWEDCVKKNPKSALAHTYLGGSYMKKGLKRKAFEELKLALQYNPKRANAWANLAYLDMESGQLDNAIQKIRLALRYEDDNYEAHNAMGLFYLQKSIYYRAIIEFRRALELRPESISDFVQIYRYLGTAYHKDKQNQKAIESLNKGLEFVPDDFESILSLAIIYSFYKNEKKKAMYYFDMMVKLRPSDQNIDTIQARINNM